jgi:hypothetical protein
LKNKKMMLCLQKWKIVPVQCGQSRVMKQPHAPSVLKSSWSDWNRRGFLKASAATTLGLAFSRLPVMAGPFTREDFDHLVPADKKLRPNG